MKYLCKYGCGREGIYQLKDGSWSCSKYYIQCPIKRKQSSESYMGQKAWNKGLKTGPQSNEHIRKATEARKEYRPTEETKEKMRISAGIGPDNYHWKGGGYNTFHAEAWKLIGKDKCQICNMTNEDHINKWGHRLEMHNILKPKDYTIMEQEACHSKLEHEDRKLDNG